MEIAYCNLEYALGVVVKDENDALEKLKMYHTMHGDNVFKWDPIQNHVMDYDVCYCSSIFTHTDKSILPIDSRWICGGTGFNIYSRLPAEIESLRPRKNYGFASRGCNNNCKFCVVPRKEGKCRPDIDDIREIWDGESLSVKLKDNNILQLPRHFMKICEQLKKNKPARRKSLTVDFNQGLDIRLLDNDIIKVLAYLSHEEYRFAFDSISLENIIVQKVNMLKQSGIRQSMFYVLIGFDATWEEDHYRMELLRSLGQDVSPMPYMQITPDMPVGKITHENKPMYDALDNWGEMKAWFKKMSFKEYLQTPRGKSYAKYF